MDKGCSTFETLEDEVQEALKEGLAQNQALKAEITALSAKHDIALSMLDEANKLLSDVAAGYLGPFLTDRKNA